MRPMARSEPRLFLGSAAVFVVLLAFCEGSAGEVDDNPVFVIAATTAPPTTLPPTTAPPPATAAPSTASAPVNAIATTVATTTTSTIVLPQPIAPPDPNADEPLVEIGRIEIPRISLDRPVYEGITLGTLDNGPLRGGHADAATNPGAGKWGRRTQTGGIVPCRQSISSDRHTACFRPWSGKAHETSTLLHA